MLLRTARLLVLLAFSLLAVPYAVEAQQGMHQQDRQAWYELNSSLEGASMPMNILPLGGLSILGWLLAGFVPVWIPLVLITVLGIGFAKPLGGVQTPGGTHITWGFWDYVGIALIIAVIIALAQGTTGKDVVSMILGHAPGPK